MGKRGPKANPEVFRKQRGIRFSDPEWRQVKAEADKHNMPVSKFVRETVLEATNSPKSKRL